MSVIRWAPATGAFFAVLVSFGAAAATSPPTIDVKGQEYDPGRDCVANAEWVKGAGLADETDPDAWGFLLQKQCPTATNAASFGVFKLRKNTHLGDLQEFGFDYKNFDGDVQANCQFGATYFQILISDGDKGNYMYFGPGCTDPSNSVWTNYPQYGWTRVRMNLSQFVPQYHCNKKCTRLVDGNPPPIWCLPENAVVNFLQLAFDQGPDQGPNEFDSHVILDNIMVGAQLINHPSRPGGRLPRFEE